MGDVRFQPSFARIRDARHRLAEIRRSSDQDIIAALAGASTAPDPLLANVLATEALNRAERARRAIDSVTDAVIAVDRDGCVTLVNPAAERGLGWLHDEVIGRPLHDVLPRAGAGSDPDAPAPPDLLDPLRTAQALHEPAAAFRRRDGTTLRAAVTAAPTRVHDDVVGAVIVMHDPERAPGSATTAPMPSRPPAEDAADAAPTPPRVLIAEDEAVVAMALAATLRDAGYDVVDTVASGEAAIEVARSRDLDLVLMDIHLQGDVDGVAAAEAIRQDDPLPIVYLTAFSDEDTLRRAKLPEPAGYIVKPYEESGLLAAVEVAIHHGERQRDRRLAWRALRGRERLLQSILDHVPSLVALKDEQGRYLLVNRAFEKTFRVARADARGKSDGDLFEPALARALREHDDDVLDAGASVEFEASLPGTPAPSRYAFHKLPLPRAADAPGGLCAIGTPLRAPGARPT